MSKVIELPDDIREEHLELLNRIFVYPIGIKLSRKQLELHIDDGRV